MEHRPIIKCNHCHKIYRVSDKLWKTLLEKWGTAKNIQDNYTCKACELPFPTVNRVNSLFQEHASPEEQQALGKTLDGKQFNITGIKNFLQKMILYKRLYGYNKPSIRVIPTAEVQRFSEMSDVEQDREAEPPQVEPDKEIEPKTE